MLCTLMIYLLYRIKESNGFLAKRAIVAGYWVALITYGQAAIKDKQIITPEMMYAQPVNPPDKSG